MTDSIQDQLVAARRKQILEAAAKVFAEKGFHTTTIKDIARAAGIADGTIYNYFENKTALLFALFDLMTEAIQRDSDFAALGEASVPEVDLHTSLRTYLRHPLMALKGDNFELFRVVVAEIMVNAELRALYYRKILAPTLAIAETQFQQWAEQRRIKPVDSRLAARVISGVVLGLILEHSMGDQVLASQWDELPDFLSHLLLDGLAAEES